MDVNGVKFHLLLGRDDWSKCTVDGETLMELWSASPPRPGEGSLEWNDHDQELTLHSKLLKYVASQKDTPPSLDSRRGAGRDRYGNWYWIDESKKRLLALSTGSGTTSDFWYPGLGDKCTETPRFGEFGPVAAPAPPEPLTLSGLAVTEDHYLIVGTQDPGGLLIFDLRATGEPQRLIWPEPVPFAPYDMAPRPGGGVWILDRHNRRYWAMDRGFNLVTRRRDDQLLAEAREEDFQPLIPGERRQIPGRTFPRGITLDLSSPLKLKQPIAIEALPDGTVLILDYDPTAKFSQIYRYDFDEQIGEPVSTEAMKARLEVGQDQEFKLIGYDIALVPEHEDAGISVPDRLFVASSEGNQSFAFNVCRRNGQLVLIPVAEFFPMRLFGGKGIVAAGNNAWYDFSNRWVPLIRQCRPRFESEAMLLTQPFDGYEPDCVWHRLLLDANIPPDTKVLIRSRAANDLIDLEVAAWQREPAPYLRSDGPELPFLPRRSATPAIGEGTWELLFQRARGRFLQLEITLSGNERSSPRLRALRAYYPRFSYLSNYLPAVYREDAESSSFLERFLSNQEGLLTTLEDKIAAVQVLFDTRSAPKETLDWLTTWFGVALDPAWDEDKRRLFITHAMDFFQARGTARGLKMALRLALEPCADEMIFIQPAALSRQSERIRIVEKFLTRRTPGIVFGDTTELKGLRQTSVATRWDPRQGGAQLHQRYTDFINDKRKTQERLIEYPVMQPENDKDAADWRLFSQQNLGFIPSSAVLADRLRWQMFLANKYLGADGLQKLNAAHQTNYADFTSLPMPSNQPKVAAASEDWEEFVTAGRIGVLPVERQRLKTYLDRLEHMEHLLTEDHVDVILLERQQWQHFLARRYRRINALNDLYAVSWASFDLIPLPQKLPSDGEQLLDWFQFQSTVMVMHRLAHRFTALLPIPAVYRFDFGKQQQQRELAKRIIELEKPAHTIFDIKFYWALFRIGEARLGSDTLIDRGSRAPQLMPQMILGENFVGESWLAGCETAPGTPARGF